MSRPPPTVVSVAVPEAISIFQCAAQVVVVHVQRQASHELRDLRHHYTCDDDTASRHGDSARSSVPAVADARLYRTSSFVEVAERDSRAACRRDSNLHVERVHYSSSVDVHRSRYACVRYRLAHARGQHAFIDEYSGSSLKASRSTTLRYSCSRDPYCTKRVVTRTPRLHWTGNQS